MWYLWTGITIYGFLLVLGRVHCPTAVDHILALVTLVLMWPLIPVKIAVCLLKGD